MCLVKTPKVQSNPAEEKKQLPILRNPLLDGINPVINSLRIGRNSLRIDRGNPGNVSGTYPAAPAIPSATYGGGAGGGASDINASILREARMSSYRNL